MPSNDPICFGSPFASNEEIQSALYEACGTKIGAQFVEAPLYIYLPLRKKLFEALEEISAQLSKLDWRNLAQRISTKEFPTKNLNIQKPPEIIAIDFAVICSNGSWSVKLVELQGAVGAIMLQLWLSGLAQTDGNVPHKFQELMSMSDAIQSIKNFINPELAKKSILMEVRPDTQPNIADMRLFSKYLSIEIIDAIEIFKKVESGEAFKARWRCAISRLMLDELSNFGITGEKLERLLETCDYFVPNPLWGRLMSKWILPKLNGEFTVDSRYILDSVPNNIHNYVLKPFFSRGGQGVIIRPNLHDISAARKSGEYILQRYIDYALIKSIASPVKIELRLMCTWRDWKLRPEPLVVMARSTRGDSMAVSANRTFRYTGVSSVFFERLRPCR